MNNLILYDCFKNKSHICSTVVILYFILLIILNRFIYCILIAFISEEYTFYYKYKLLINKHNILFIYFYIIKVGEYNKYK